MKSRVEIKKNSTTEVNVSSRTITYDLIVDGEYQHTVNDIIEALNWKEQMDSQLYN